MTEKQKSSSKGSKDLDQPMWTCRGCFGIVYAATRSEARAKFKEQRGGKRLPAGMRPELVSPAIGH